MLGQFGQAFFFYGHTSLFIKKSPMQQYASGFFLSHKEITLLLRQGQQLL